MKNGGDRDMLKEDAMSKQQKPESRGNELRNHIREQRFLLFLIFAPSESLT